MHQESFSDLFFRSFFILFIYLIFFFFFSLIFSFPVELPMCVLYADFNEILFIPNLSIFQRANKGGKD